MATRRAEPTASDPGTARFAEVPAHSENVNFFGTINVEVDSELAKLDPAGYRPLRARRRERPLAPQARPCSVCMCARAFQSRGVAAIVVVDTERSAGLGAAWDGTSDGRWRCWRRPQPSPCQHGCAGRWCCHRWWRIPRSAGHWPPRWARRWPHWRPPGVTGSPPGARKRPGRHQPVRRRRPRLSAPSPSAGTTRPRSPRATPRRRIRPRPRDPLLNSPPPPGAGYSVRVRGAFDRHRGEQLRPPLRRRPARQHAPVKWPFRRGAAQPEPPGPVPGTRVEASAERAVAIRGNNYAPVLTGDHSRAVSLPPEALRPRPRWRRRPGWTRWRYARARSSAAPTSWSGWTRHSPARAVQWCRQWQGWAASGKAPWPHTGPPPAPTAAPPSGGSRPTVPPVCRTASPTSPAPCSRP
ncbi:hypothetical protein BX265_8452 [Streptomyces sp. TLI_235]|nr:hypothetical protein BX265_8452 [Streptomyces sp. TLI_235]